MCTQSSGGGEQPPATAPPTTSSSSSPTTTTDPTAHPFPVPDSHCHPTDTPSAAHLIPHMRASHLTAMSTNGADQALVASLCEQFPTRVIPAFGWHPWFSYLIWDDSDAELLSLRGKGEGGEADAEFKLAHYKRVLKGGAEQGGLTGEFVARLPSPRALRGDVLPELRGRLRRYKDAGRGVVLGEVGLDRGFRLPWPGGPERGEGEEEDGDKGRALSPYKVAMDHQVLVFTAQLGVAGELGVPASVHGVQAHGTMFDTLRGLWRGWEVRVESRRERRNRETRGRKLGGREREWVDRFLLEGKGLEELDSEEEEEEEEEEGEGEEAGRSGGGEDGEDGASITPPPPPAHPKKPPPKTKPSGPPPFPPRLCLHSFSAPPQTLSQYLNNPTPTTAYPTDVYFSFSTTINSRNRPRLEEVLKMVPRERLLVESDLHVPGEEMDRVLEEAVEVVREMKGWEGGVDVVRRVVGENWGRWVFGEGWRGKMGEEGSGIDG